MKVEVIKTKKQYSNALKEIDRLLDCKPGSKESEKLELISILVESYENIHFPIESPDPIEAINIRMEQMGLSRKDLEQSIGSRARVSEILNKKRDLTITMIRKLREQLSIPADILIQKVVTK